MKNTMQISNSIIDDHMIELSIELNTSDLFIKISCYTHEEKLYELNVLCDQFVNNIISSFSWKIGTQEYTCFEMFINPYDKHGHVKFDIKIYNNKHSTLVDKMYCECCLMFELGQIESLGKEVLKLVTDNDIISI